jgi:hypothetical protein
MIDMSSHKSSPSQALRIGAQVITPRGLGSVCFVYPKGPHHKITYLVSLQGYRLNRIFDERELQLVVWPQAGRSVFQRRR